MQSVQVSPIKKLLVNKKNTVNSLIWSAFYIRSTPRFSKWTWQQGHRLRGS